MLEQTRAAPNMPGMITVPNSKVSSGISAARLVLRSTTPGLISRPHTPKDNATNERFNRTLEEEFIQLGNFTPDIPEFNRNLTEWLIEYNFKRPHQSLGYMSPINFIYKHQPLLPMYPSSR